MNLNDNVWFRFAPGRESLRDELVGKGSVKHESHGYYRVQLWVFASELGELLFNGCEPVVLGNQLHTSLPPIVACSSHEPCCTPTAPAWLVGKCGGES